MSVHTSWYFLKVKQTLNLLRDYFLLYLSCHAVIDSFYFTSKGLCSLRSGYIYRGVDKFLLTGNPNYSQHLNLVKNNFSSFLKKLFFYLFYFIQSIKLFWFWDLNDQNDYLKDLVELGYSWSNLKMSTGALKHPVYS